MEDKRHFRKRLIDVVGQVDASFRQKALDDMNLLLDSGTNTITELIAVAANKTLPTELRSIACWFLSRLGDDRAVPALLECLNDKNPELRSEAARSLGTIGSLQTVPILIDKLKSDLSADVRFHAIYALGLLADEAALIPILETLLDSSEAPKVRGIAAETLSVFPGQRTIEALKVCLSDPQVEVRYWSAFALGELGVESALPELRRLASIDESSLPDGSSIKEEAADAINKINDRAKGPDTTDADVLN